MNAPTPTRSRLRALVPELGFVAAALAVNLLVRWYTSDDLGRAVANAHDVHAWQQSVGLDWEHAVQEAALSVPHLAELASRFYVLGYFPVLLGVMAWTFWSRPATYRTLRNALLVSGAVGMLGYAFYPLAPPRLTDLGYHDTVAAGPLDDAARPSGLANEIAAMPSFHVGWLALAAAAVLAATGSLLLRALAVLHPMVMAWAVLATGNHWVVDIPAGLLLAALGLYVARRWDRRRSGPPGDVPTEPLSRPARWR